MEWLFGILIGLGIGLVGLWFFLNFISSKKMLRAGDEAKRLLKEAKTEAESLKK
jgi:hypothetical protein